MKNSKKERSLNNTNASFPIIWAKVVLPVEVGGMAGNKKAVKPRKAADTMPI